MDERDAFALRADPGRLVDKADSGGSTPRQRRVEVGRGEADVVESGTAAVVELGNRRIRICGFEEFYEGITGGKPGDRCAVGVIEGHDGKSENVSVEGQGVAKGANGNADMVDGDARSARVIGTR